MLTLSEARAINEIARRYPARANAGAEALSIVQRSRGWIPDELLADTAAHVNMSAAELDSVATFYNRIYRRPVGKHVILLCGSVSCWIMGKDSLRDYLLKSLGLKFVGDTTIDGLFTLLDGVCLGACDLSPAMMLDNVLHGNLTQAKIDSLIAECRNSPAESGE